MITQRTREEILAGESPSTETAILAFSPQSKSWASTRLFVKIESRPSKQTMRDYLTAAREVQPDATAIVVDTSNNRGDFVEYHEAGDRYIRYERGMPVFEITASCSTDDADALADSLLD
jgi:hypothetical protein